ncbi:hypothetical protein BLNAU_19465 [Blattamonas nauphoetae]|uniref:Uncharacterized protein n=1 Tax=Blattamonas nauphoetae TaxID=2049346 RepID=A0ABQ9X5K9_9EUKA|nr:hypothetical protein BLNAU_19465 [Blattamonas nauphoetae]
MNMIIFSILFIFFTTCEEVDYLPNIEDVLIAVVDPKDGSDTNQCNETNPCKTLRSTYVRAQAKKVTLNIDGDEAFEEDVNINQKEMHVVSTGLMRTLIIPSFEWNVYLYQISTKASFTEIGIMTSSNQKHTTTIFQLNPGSDVRVTDCSLKGTGESPGRVSLVRSNGGKAILDKVSIYGFMNRNGNLGGFYVTGKSDIRVSNVDINGLMVEGESSFVTFDSSGTLVFQNITIGNLSSNGGHNAYVYKIVSNTAESNLTLDNITISGESKKTFSGGLIDAHRVQVSCLTMSNMKGSDFVLGKSNTAFFSSRSGSTQRIESAKISNVTLTGYGLIIGIDHGSMSVVGCEFSHMVATGDEAIIFVNRGSLTLSRTGFDVIRSEHHSGSAIKLFKGKDCRIESSSFTRCSSFGQDMLKLFKGGGAIATFKSPSLHVSNSTFSECKSSIAGGAICVSELPTLSIAQSSFLSCSSPIGGAIASMFDKDTSGNTTLTDVQGTSCEAELQGGFMHMGFTSKLTVSNSVFSLCSSKGEGGVFSLNSQTGTGNQMRNVSFVTNTARQGSGSDINDVGRQSQNVWTSSSFVGCSSSSSKPAFVASGKSLDSLFTAHVVVLTEFYIDEKGEDTETCGTIESPCLTSSRGFDQKLAKTTLFYGSGTYGSSKRIIVQKQVVLSSHKEPATLKTLSGKDECLFALQNSKMSLSKLKLVAWSLDGSSSGLVIVEKTSTLTLSSCVLSALSSSSLFSSLITLTNADSVLVASNSSFRDVVFESTPKSRLACLVSNSDEVKLSNCTFLNITSPKSTRGVGIDATLSNSAHFSVVDTSFTSCSSDAVKGRGGAILIDVSSGSANMSLSGVVFKNNSAGHGRDVFIVSPVIASLPFKSIFGFDWKSDSFDQVNALCGAKTLDDTSILDLISFLSLKYLSTVHVSSSKGQSILSCGTAEIPCPTLDSVKEGEFEKGITILVESTTCSTPTTFRRIKMKPLDSSDGKQGVVIFSQSNTATPDGSLLTTTESSEFSEIQFKIGSVTFTSSFCLSSHGSLTLSRCSLESSEEYSERTTNIAFLTTTECTVNITSFTTTNVVFTGSSPVIQLTDPLSSNPSHTLTNLSFVDLTLKNSHLLSLKSNSDYNTTVNLANCSIDSSIVSDSCISVKSDKTGSDTKMKLQIKGMYFTNTTYQTRPFMGTLLFLTNCETSITYSSFLGVLCTDDQPVQCTWGSSAVALENSITKMINVEFKLFQDGALVIRGGKTAITDCVFKGNNPHYDLFPAFRKNIQVSSGGKLSISSVKDGDGADHTDAWVSSTSDVTLVLTRTIRAPFFTPVLKEFSINKIDDRDEYAVVAEGLHFAPCGMWLAVISKSLTKTSVSAYGPFTNFESNSIASINVPAGDLTGKGKIISLGLLSAATLSTSIDHHSVIQPIVVKLSSEKEPVEKATAGDQLFDGTARTVVILAFAAILLIIIIVLIVVVARRISRQTVPLPHGMRKAAGEKRIHRKGVKDAVSRMEKQIEKDDELHLDVAKVQVEQNQTIPLELPSNFPMIVQPSDNSEN